MLTEQLESRLLMARPLGIDVSHWDGTINWTSVRAAGKEFAFQKATEGTTYTDPTFTTNMNAGKAAGVLMGAYHFARPASNTAAAEAQHFLDVAGSFITSGWLHPVLDLEVDTSIGKTAMTNWTNAWCAYVKNATGVDPIIYTGNNIANNYVDSTVAQHSLWFANWPSNPDPQNGGPTASTGVWSTWNFWQYTDAGSVSGIAGGCDFDVYQGDRASLEANYLIGSAPVSGPEVTVTRSTTNILDGQATAISFGSVAQNSAAPSITFTVKNDGNASLSLSSLTVPTGFSITDDLVPSLAPGLSDTFIVQMPTATTGTKSGSISFNNNDSNENPFNFPVTGTVTTPAPSPASITGKVYSDNDRSASLTTGDTGLSTWTVYIDANHDGSLNSTEKRMTTDGSGNYSFTGLTPGVSYRIRELLKKRWSRTTATFIDVPTTAGVTVTNINFGNYSSRYSPAPLTAQMINTSLSSFAFLSDTETARRNHDLI